MNKTGVAVIAFIFGAGVGSYTTYQLVKKKFADIAQEEIDSIKDLYSRKKAREEKSENKSEIAAKAREKADIIEYAKKIHEEKYTPDEPEESVDYAIIAESEFGEQDDYDCITLTYYADGVLTDDEDDVMTDYEHIVGNFEDYYEKDSDVVYVRNDARRVYYEIVRDDRDYREVVGDEEED